MNLKTAFQMQAKLKSLLTEASSACNAQNFTSSTITYVKSDINKLLKIDSFADEVKDVSVKNYGKYQIDKLCMVIDFIVDTRTKLATGIAIAKNAITIEDKVFCYDSLIQHNNDKRLALTFANIDTCAADDEILDKESVYYGEGTISYPIVRRRITDKNSVDTFKAFRNNYNQQADNLSRMIEAALYTTEIPEQYVVNIPFSITLDELYNNIDTILANMVDVTAEDIESETAENPEE